jgi:hypothetical protein
MILSLRFAAAKPPQETTHIYKREMGNDANDCKLPQSALCAATSRSRGRDARPSGLSEPIGSPMPLFPSRQELEGIAGIKNSASNCSNKFTRL